MCSSADSINFGDLAWRYPSAISVAYRDCQEGRRGTLADRLGHGHSPQAAQEPEILFGNQVTLIDIEPAFAICHRYICVLGLFRRKCNLQLASNPSWRWCRNDNSSRLVPGWNLNSCREYFNQVPHRTGGDSQAANRSAIQGEEYGDDDLPLTGFRRR
jgi:hypothetical protein